MAKDILQNAPGHGHYYWSIQQTIPSCWFTNERERERKKKKEKKRLNEEKNYKKSERCDKEAE